MSVYLLYLQYMERRSEAQFESKQKIFQGSFSAGLANQGQMLLKVTLQILGIRDPRPFPREEHLGFPFLETFPNFSVPFLT